jgi:DNA (cytosine-5)-methyltransferase 1
MHDVAPFTRTCSEKRPRIHAADLFAGAGGASTGLTLAADACGIDLDLVAVNHWPAAVSTHAANHPTARHLCEAVERVDPRDAVPGGHLDLLVAGPECTFFSTARGGRPIDDQRRSSAWSILRWLELLRVDHVLIENVPEFASWGPLDARGRPLKTRRGEVYRAFLAAIEAMNYRVDARVLNAADFGEATTRRRLFIQATRGRRRITWPEPSHSRRGEASLLRQTMPWRPAREVIDWTLPSSSIFNRKRPLSRNTIRRIEAGLKRFGGRPFVLGQQSGSVPRSTDEPMPTIAAGGAISCVQPFILPPRHMNEGPVDSVERPLRTITAVAGHAFGLVEPFLVEYHSPRPGEAPRVRALDEPLPTQTTENRFGLVTVERDDGDSSTLNLGANGFDPFIVQVTHGGRERPVDQPLPTITGGQRGDLALIEPFTLPYCSNGGELARPVSQPIGTITTRDRFALVIPEGMDIRFRMLQPNELAAAMGFPPGYRFIGKKGDAIRMIGNAWSCRVAQALCSCILERHAVRHTRDHRREAAS